MPKHRPIIAIVCIGITALAVRIWTFMALPDPLLNADSYGYLSLGKQILDSPSVAIIVTPYRTPIYPIVSASAMAMTGALSTPNTPIRFAYAMQMLTLLQAAAGIVGAVFGYMLLRCAGVSPPVAVAAGILLAVDPHTAAAERAVMTEGFAVPALLALLWGGIHAIKKPSRIIFAGVAALSAFTFLLRPALLPAGMLVAGLLVYRFRNDKRLRIWAGTTLAVVITVPFLYGALNRVYHGYPGIQQVSDIDILGRIFEFRLPMDAGYESETFYRPAVAWQESDGSTQPFHFLDSLGKDTYTDRKKIAELHGFVGNIVRSQPIPYITNALAYLPTLITERSAIPQQTNIYARTLDVFDRIFSVTKHIAWVVFALLPVAAWLFIRNQTVQTGTRLLLGAIPAMLAVLTILIVYHEDYGRLAGVFMPVVYLAAAKWTDDAASWIRRRASGRP